jgi:Arc/MetJ-type ribon-helix-helix transcriptional regulator
MAKSMIIRARVDAIFAAKVEAWAEEKGFVTVSDYLRVLVEKDLASGGVIAERKPEPQAGLTDETTIVTGLMVARILSQVIGVDEAKKFEAWAREAATNHLQEELANRVH